MGFKWSELTQRKWNTPLQSVAQAFPRELQSPTDSLGRLGSLLRDPRSGLTPVAPQSCLSSEKPPARHHGCYKFPQEKGTVAWNGQSLGVRVEKRRQLLTSLIFSHPLSNQPWLFWLLAHHAVSEQVLPPSAQNIFTDWIYFIIFSSHAQGPPSAQLFVSASPPAVTFSASHQHTLSVPFETIYKVLKEHKFTFFPSKYIRDLTVSPRTKTGLIQRGFEKVKFCDYPVSNYIIFSCAYTLFVFILLGYTNKWVCWYYLWYSKSYVQQHKVHTNEQKSITDLYVQSKQKWISETLNTQFLISPEDTRFED